MTDNGTLKPTIESRYTTALANIKSHNTIADAIKTTNNPLAITFFIDNPPLI